MDFFVFGLHLEENSLGHLTLGGGPAPYPQWPLPCVYAGRSLVEPSLLEPHTSQEFYVFTLLVSLHTVELSFAAALILPKPQLEPLFWKEQLFIRPSGTLCF